MSEKIMLPQTVRLPSAASMTSRQLLQIIGWSRQLLYLRRKMDGFPAGRIMKTSDVAEWLINRNVKVTWL